MVEWKKLPLALVLAAFVAPLAPAGASAGGIGDCTHQIKLPTRSDGENVRILVFMKTPGEELTAYTGKKGVNEAKIKVGSSFLDYENERTKTEEASAENIDNAYDLVNARRAAVYDDSKPDKGGFQIYIHLKHPDGRKAVCVIDGDQKNDRVNALIKAKLSRLKCIGTEGGAELRVNSCQARDFLQANGVRVGYWADVEFVD